MNILVCFDDNDYLITRINCTLEEAKEYYIDNDFSYWSGEHNKEESHEAKFILDIDKEFEVEYTNKVLDEMVYKFDNINTYDDSSNSLGIVLYNKSLNDYTVIEPNWFWKFNKRIVNQ